MKDARGIVTDLVLCAVAVQTLPFRQQLDLAAAHGFDAISVSNGSLARILAKENLSTGEMRALAERTGVRITDVESAGDWLSAPPASGPRWMTPAFNTNEFLQLTTELGATTLAAVHFGDPAPLDLAAQRFAELCDTAAEHGLRVALEFVAFATINDIASAWDIIHAADRPNGGIVLDIWHHIRSGADPSALRSVPGDRIFSVQLSDGLREPQGTLLEDTAQRLQPGRGEFKVPQFLDQLAEMDVHCPFGIETFDQHALAANPDAHVAEMASAMRDVLGYKS